MTGSESHRYFLYAFQHVIIQTKLKVTTDFSEVGKVRPYNWTIYKVGKVRPYNWTIYKVGKVRPYNWTV